MSTDNLYSLLKGKQLSVQQKIELCRSIYDQTDFELTTPYRLLICDALISVMFGKTAVASDWLPLLQTVSYCLSRNEEDCNMQLHTFGVGKNFMTLVQKSLRSNIDKEESRLINDLLLLMTSDAETLNSVVSSLSLQQVFSMIAETTRTSMTVSIRFLTSTVQRLSESSSLVVTSLSPLLRHISAFSDPEYDDKLANLLKQLLKLTIFHDSLLYRYQQALGLVSTDKVNVEKQPVALSNVNKFLDLLASLKPGSVAFLFDCFCDSFTTERSLITRFAQLCEHLGLDSILKCIQQHRLLDGLDDQTATLRDWLSARIKDESEVSLECAPLLIELDASLLLGGDYLHKLFIRIHHELDGACLAVRLLTAMQTTRNMQVWMSTLVEYLRSATEPKLFKDEINILASFFQRLTADDTLMYANLLFDALFEGLASSNDSTVTLSWTVLSLLLSHSPIRNYSSKEAQQIRANLEKLIATKGIPDTLMVHSRRFQKILWDLSEEPPPTKRSKSTFGHKDLDCPESEIMEFLIDPESWLSKPAICPTVTRLLAAIDALPFPNCNSPYVEPPSLNSDFVATFLDYLPYVLRLASVDEAVQTLVELLRILKNHPDMCTSDDDVMPGAAATSLGHALQKQHAIWASRFDLPLIWLKSLIVHAFQTPLSDNLLEDWKSIKTSASKKNRRRTSSASAHHGFPITLFTLTPWRRLKLSDERIVFAEFALLQLTRSPTSSRFNTALLSVVECALSLSSEVDDDILTSFMENLLQMWREESTEAHWRRMFVLLSSNGCSPFGRQVLKCLLGHKDLTEVVERLTNELLLSSHKMDDELISLLKGQRETSSLPRLLAIACHEKNKKYNGKIQSVLDKSMNELGSCDELTSSESSLGESTALNIMTEPVFRIFAVRDSLPAVTFPNAKELLNASKFCKDHDSLVKTIVKLPFDERNLFIGDLFGHKSPAALTVLRLVASTEAPLAAEIASQLTQTVLPASLETLQLYTTLLNTGDKEQKQLLARRALMVLQELDLGEIQPSLFPTAFRNCCTLLRLLLDRPAMIMERQLTAALCEALRRMLTALARFCASPEVDTKTAMRCVQQYSVLYRPVSRRSDSFIVKGRIHLLLIAHYTETLCVYPNLGRAYRRVLDRAIFKLLTLCGRKGLKYLQTSLGNDRCEMLRLLFEDYEKHFKFKGFI